MQYSVDEFQKVAELFEKSAMPLLLKGIGGAMKSLGGAVSNTIKSAPDRISNFMNTTGKQYAKNVGNFVGTGLSGRQAMTGIRQIGSAMRNGNLRQGRFNAGLKNLAIGAGKTGLTYGGAIYGGSKLYDAFTQ